ncbi:MAG: HEPN domain-containing protein [archaeon YNP-WB-062]|nr:HEPN domain-containing protein [Candidatus Culexarchaeum yellowstonense]
MEEGLPTILWRLSRDIVNVVETLKERGKIRRIKRLWFREKITNFEYKEGSMGWQASPEYFEKEEWDWRDRFRIIEPEIKKMPTYINAHRYISEIYKVNELRAEFLLSRFVHNVIIKALDATLSEEELVELITLFHNDLEGAPIIWNVTVELRGIWLKDEEIIVDEGLKLRRPRPEDLAYECPVEEMIERAVPRFHVPFFSHATAVLEITQRSQSQLNLLDELEKIIIALRLYKPASIAKIGIVWRPKSILQFESVTWYTPIQPEIYRYSLASEDASKLKTLLDKIKPLLPVVQGRIETIDHISISLQRYDDALFKPDPMERLTYAIMSLEALFLKSSEREELKHRLAQRVARCLSLYGYQSLEVYRTVAQSYDIRSEFVHGTLINKEKKDYTATLADKVIEYLRTSILMFLELKDEIEKDNFLNTIDNSLLHQDAFTKLEKLIRENTPITTSLIPV